MKKAVAIIITVLLLANVSHEIASFQGLGLPEGFLYTWNPYISSDGSVIACTSYTSTSYEAFRWTKEEGFQSLSEPLSGNFAYSSRAVSGNGSIISGDGSLGSFRWTESGGLEFPQELESALIYDISFDGTVMVGALANEAILWTEQDSVIGLGYLPGGSFRSLASAVSEDGLVVVGKAMSSSGLEAFRWTQTDGMIGLGDLEGGNFESLAYDVSIDGSVVVGKGESESGFEAFRWENDVMTGLGDLEGGIFGSEAYGVSADGSVIVGQSNSDLGIEAFIWDEDNGMRKLQDVLENIFQLDLTGWTLQGAYGISANGLTIVGEGINPVGDTEAWIATVPEPVSIMAFGYAFMVLMKYGSKQNRRKH